MQRLCLAFCVNRLMFGPMCVALHSSLIRYAGDLPPVYVLHADLESCQIRILHDLFGHADLRVRKIDLRPFRSLRPLHGSHTPYGKLLIPTIIDDDEVNVLYLDSDVVVAADLSVIRDHTSEDYTLGAVGRAGAWAWQSLDWPLYQRLGMDAQSIVFNSGVMLLHAPRCREFRLLQRGLALGAQHGSMLRSADQPLFNALFHESFHWLPPRFNICLSPSIPLMCGTDDGVYHFEGSPKPWDLLGDRLHANYHVFQAAFEKLGVPWSLIRSSPFRDALRSMRLLRSYWQAYKRRPRTR